MCQGRIGQYRAGYDCIWLGEVSPSVRVEIRIEIVIVIVINLTLLYFISFYLIILFYLFH